MHAPARLHTHTHTLFLVHSKATFGKKLLPPPTHTQTPVSAGDGSFCFFLSFGYTNGSCFSGCWLLGEIVFTSQMVAR